jgi:hypothetical protein
VRPFRAVGAVAALVVSLLVVACGSGGEDVTVEGKTPPTEIIEAMSFNGVRSATFGATFEILNIVTKDELDLNLTAGFDNRKQETLPPFFITVGSHGEHHGQYFEFNGRLFYAGTNAILTYGPAFKELAYEFEPEDFQKFKKKLEKVQSGGGAGDARACFDAAAEVEAGSLISDLRYRGSQAETEGPRLFLVGGKLDVQALVDVLGELAEDPSCGAQLKALGLPSPAELSELERQIEQGRVIIGVDKHGLPRYFQAELHLAGQQKEKTLVKLYLALQTVNEDPEIPDSAEGEPAAVLLRKFGVKPKAAFQASGDQLLISLLEGFGGGATGHLP